MIIKDTERFFEEGQRKMYGLYIPKYKADLPSELLLPEALAFFMGITDYAYDLLVSLGYRETVEDAMKVISSSKERKDLKIMKPPEKIDIIFFGKTPGSRAMPSTREITVDGVNEKDSHRQRVIFFLDKERKPIPPILKRETKKAFLEKRTVKAVLIGMECGTYLNREKEGSLLLFVDEEYGNIADAQISLGLFHAFQNMVFGETTVDLGDPEKYFKRMLRHFLDTALAK